jgi:hypothetical protein
MSRPGGFQNDDVARGAGVQLAKGAGLVLLAIIIGIVLLQVVDDGDVSNTSAGASSTTTTTQRNTTTTRAPTTRTTVASTPAKAPDQVRVIVLNAGAATGAAGDLSDALRTKGYTNQVRATDWPGASGKGTSVYCKPGFEREASMLAIAVGAGTKTPSFPSPPPPSSENVDCVVAVGA